MPESPWFVDPGWESFVMARKQGHVCKNLLLNLSVSLVAFDPDLEKVIGMYALHIDSGWHHWFFIRYCPGCGKSTEQIVAEELPSGLTYEPPTC